MNIEGAAHAISMVISEFLKSKSNRLFSKSGLWAAIILCLMPVTTGCDGGFLNEPYPEDDILKMIWETGGGGDLRFEIVRDGENFDITVIRCAFEAVDQQIVVTALDGEVYELISDIFDKIRDLYDDTYVPYGVSGSWTSIMLLFTGGEEIVIKNISAWNDLHILYTFVEAHIRT